MVKLLVNGNEVKFETTIFPDGTSQVWKLEDVVYDTYGDDPVILWLFESEAEVMHVVQLAMLVQRVLNADTCTLRVPYLPYGRQDKALDNKLSFALHVFKEIMHNANITRIETFDAHSKTSMVYEDAFTGLPKVTEFHEHILDVSKASIVCFPDKGAAERYKNLSYMPYIYFEKVRDQLTGVITGIKMINPQGLNLRDENLLIVDDICDGGMTFIKVAEYLREFKTKEINLVVSHGLFSKGRQVLHDAGIKNVYTTNSLLRNPEGFKIW